MSRPKSGTGTCVPVLLLFILYGIIGLSEASTCTYILPDCTGPNCEEKIECVHGYCNVLGQCQCDPCFKGKSCSDYDDLYAPRFSVREDTVVYNQGSGAPVYKARAEDSDRGLTCPLAFDMKCACADIVYSIVDYWNLTSRLFRIDPVSGYVYLQEGVLLEEGSYHLLPILASNPSNPLSMDMLNLTVMIHTPDSMNELLASEKLMESTQRDQVLLEEALPGDLGSMEASMKPLVREKRDSSGTDMGSTTLTLSVVGSAKADIGPGEKMVYQLKVVLPTLTSSAMDIVVEVFVMDPVSGETALALCSFHVVSVGGGITDSNNQPLDVAALNQKIVNKQNTRFDKLNDHAILDFGMLKNSDPASGGTAGDSDIIIEFTVVMIINANYENASVNVMAGADFSSETYLFIATANTPISTSKTTPTDQEITLTNEGGATEIAQYTAMTFTVDAYIATPFGTMSFEAFTGNYEHDKFTISHAGITSMGASWSCSPVESFTDTDYKSVTARSVHRSVSSGLMISSEIDYGNLAAATTDDKFKITYAFSVFVMDAEVGDTLSVAAGMLVSDTNIWTATINLTVTAGSMTPDASTPPVSLVASNPAISSTEVAEGGTATHGVVLTIPADANTEVDCTIPGDADNFVCGVNYGKKIGKNIGYLPDLNEYVVYDGTGKATFTFNINSTGAGDNDVLFEVSIHYPTGNPGTVTMDCNGETVDLTASLASSAGIEDMSGTAESLVTGTDVNWYEGSVGGIGVTLKFPKNSVAYKKLEMESAGDLEISGWGAEVCKAEVVSAGRGVPCIAANKASISNSSVRQMARDDSVYNDSWVLDLGSACGVDRLSATEADYEVKLRFFYHIPLGQSVVPGNVKLSIGGSLDAVLIWTGWTTIAVTTGAPSTKDAKNPIFALIDPDAQTVAPGVPYLIKINLKLHPGTVGVYTIKAVTDAPTILSICRVYILAVGSNIPCMDQEIYGFEDDPLKITSVVHNIADWGESITLNLGTVRNLGSASNSIYSDLIGDDDTISLGIMVRGMGTGAATLSATLDNTGDGYATEITQAFTVTGAGPNAGAAPVIAVEGTEEGTKAYKGVMKMVDIKMTFSAGFRKVVKLQIVNDQTTDISLCFAGLFVVGKNLPCVVPATIEAVKTNTSSQQTIDLDLLEVCHYPFSSDPVDDELIVRFGILFLEGGGATASVSITATVGTASSSHSFSAILSGDTYTPPTVSDGFKLELVDNTTTPVKQGLTYKIAVAFTIPRFVTVPVEVGVMTPSDGGRSYVTVHGFSFRAGGGKNIGCLLEDCSLYRPTIIQNSSFDVAMIHESQTDTLVVNLGYMTNHGMSFLNGNEATADNQVFLEAEFLVADHTNASQLTGDVFTVNFAVKLSAMIFVIGKELELVRTGNEVIEMVCEFEVTEDTTSAFQPGAHIGFTYTLRHELNISQEEANNAKIRVYMPKYLSFVNDSSPPPSGVDNWSSNIPGVITNNNYVDFDIQHVFFTDNLEINFTLSVDPYVRLPKGLGEVNATVIVRPICKTKNKDDFRYCCNTTYTMFKINGPDCFDPLGMDTIDDCQLSASTAIDASSAPEKAKKDAAGNGWCPAVRDGPGWDPFITVDFLKKTRVTKVGFQSVPTKRQPTKIKVQFSHSGKSFTDACPDVIPVSSNEAILPLHCRFEARYARIIIIEADSSVAPICIRFELYGCPIDTVPASCSTRKTPLTDRTDEWRHVAYDSKHGIFYFCDFVPKKKRVQCYSTSDGETWNALPSYIGHLVGYDSATEKMYAMDRKGRAMVSSSDGTNWGIVDSTTVSGLATTIGASDGKAVPVPGKMKEEVIAVTLGPWTADYDGVQKGGAFKAKWSTCCS